MADQNFIITTHKRCNYGQHFMLHSGFAKCADNGDGLQSICKACVKIRRILNHERIRLSESASKKKNYQKNKPKLKAYLEKNKERIRAHQKEYRRAAKPHISKAGKAYYQKNKVKILKHQKEVYDPQKQSIRAKRYRDTNLETVRRAGLRYRWSNIDAMREKSRNYYLNNKEKYKVNLLNRLARKKGAPGRYSTNQWQDKLAFWGNRCYLCRESLEGKEVHMEHRKPLSRGGSNWIANIAPACAPCNLSKSSKTEKEFRAFMSSALSVQPDLPPRD